MRQQLITMLQLQEAMNTKVNAQWRQQGFAWYRAIWVECAELMDHYGWKWWKQQHCDHDQVALELIDIWHFGLSICLLKDEATLEGYHRIAADIEKDFQVNGSSEDFRENLEFFTENTLNTKSFDVAGFCSLLSNVQLNFTQLFNRYVGKNVLNMFRQDHGYKDGTYHKFWQGREDNEHLVEALTELDPSASDFSSQLYKNLQARYPS
ncbi:Dimeric dUTPase, all-alpha-NTP-PPase (MazG) superfamily [Alteromonadaceae bacterium Bs31]|nr:Dimeric dUTPase, all-alpha-NTP-PPase (MazG) superfamily [Alteromonadaceae bacterium Bs31]